MQLTCEHRRVGDADVVTCVGRISAGPEATALQDKLDAYWTLYESLLTTAKLIAPFTPFLAEALWQNLAGIFGERAPASVHLCDFPVGDPAAVDERLSDRMKLLREIASLGLSEALVLESRGWRIRILSGKTGGRGERFGSHPQQNAERLIPGRCRQPIVAVVEGAVSRLRGNDVSDELAQAVEHKVLPRSMKPREAAATCII